MQLNIGGKLILSRFIFFDDKIVDGKLIYWFQKDIFEFTQLYICVCFGIFVYQQAIEYDYAKCTRQLHISYFQPFFGLYIENCLFSFR